MSNYTSQNLIPVVNPERNAPAIKVGDFVFVLATEHLIDVTATTA